MTLSEFKAWFEGFTEDMSGAPTEKQWKKIKARVAEITGNPVTERYFYDHYWHREWRPFYSTTGGIGLSQSSFSAGSPTVAGDGFNASSAMLMLGKADALAEANGG